MTDQEHRIAETRLLFNLSEEVRVLRERILQIEWGGTDVFGHDRDLCPVCNNIRSRGHALECWMGDLAEQTPEV